MRQRAVDGEVCRPLCCYFVKIPRGKRIVNRVTPC